MVTGLISVGVFWGALYYLLRKNQENLRILPMLKQILPKNRRLLNYVRKIRKIFKSKEKQDLDNSSENQSFQVQRANDCLPNQKCSSQKNNSNVSNSRLSKTKVINKFKILKKRKSRKIRSHLQETDCLKQDILFEKKNSSHQNQQKSKSSQTIQNTLKIQNQMILEQLQFSSSAENQNEDLSFQYDDENLEIQVDNPFSNSSQNIRQALNIEN